MGILIHRIPPSFRNDPINAFLLLTSAVWWSGLAGRDLYLLPGLALLVLLGMKVFRDEKVPGPFDPVREPFFSNRFVLGFLVFQGLIFFLFTILKF